jgi:predicted membrane protein (TIGR00267 family)
MSRRVRRLAAGTQLPFVLGLMDGLLNALTLTAASLVGNGSPVTYELAFRVGAVALATSAFAVFVADYAERRAYLVRASRQLNLTAHGHLATTRLGRLAMDRSLLATAVACAASFTGATLPLLVGAALPGVSWVVAVLAVAALAGLGAFLGQLFAERPGRWAAALGCGGVAVTGLGVWLHIA